MTEGSTVKLLVAVLPEESVTVIVWIPRVVAGTMKEAVKDPVRSASTRLGVVIMGIPSKLIVMVELAAKTVPLTVTGVPTNQAVGFTVMEAGPGLRTRVASGIS